MRAIPTEERAKAVELYRSGKTYGQVHADTGYAECCIFEWVHAAGAGRSRDYPLDVSYFRNIDTPARAYWLGFLAADANIDASPKKYRLTVSLSDRDRAHVEAFRDARRARHPDNAATNSKRRGSVIFECPDSAHSDELPDADHCGHRV